MKHVVTLTTSNPSHEHVSLRRRQSTTNFMVEAADEDQAVFRATAHFRRLGHYVHEAKVYKKKEQLNEGGPLALLPVAAAVAAVGRVASPYVARYLAGVAARRGITQSAPTTLSRLVRGEVLAQGAGLGASILADKIVGHENEKETSLGSIVSTGVGSALGSRFGLAGKIGGAAASRIPAVKGAAEDIAQAAIQKAAAASKSVGDTANQVVTSALEKARGLVPGKIDLPPAKVEPRIEPKVEPLIPGRIDPVKPKIDPRIEPKVEPIVKPDVSRPTPGVKQDTLPSRSPDRAPKSSQGRSPQGKPSFFSRIGNYLTGYLLGRNLIGGRGDTDIGTLGQYRGMAPMFQHHQFAEDASKAPMNAIGRVMSKRKELKKDNAESEKNKINMEPSLKTK